MLDNSVNPGSRAARWLGPLVGAGARRSRAALHCAVLACVALTLGWTGAARADRVVVIGATGNTHQDALDDLTDAVSEAVRGLSHDAVSEAGAIDAVQQEVPEGANELRAVAEMNNAQWVVVPIVREAREDGYWITLRVGYVLENRVEEIDAEVLRAHEGARLMALLQALLRPEGLGDDVAQLAGADQTGRLAAEEAARRAQEAAEQAERDRLAAEQQAAEEREARERADFEGRERYGADKPMLFEVGLGVHPLLRAGSNGSGGTLGTFEALFGYAIGRTGLELRAGLDVYFGAAGGIALHGGAAYLASPFQRPLHLGAAVDLGFFHGLTGNRVPSFMVRAGALVVYHATSALYLEAQLPEITVLSANGGAVSLGLSVRLGTRF
ncbi:MAG: hypothetical protein H6726_07245 [Sandaracinaceae bacterium]|nr:hypothetical protein [Sandaracinaceae bacterium]